MKKRITYMMLAAMAVAAAVSTSCSKNPTWDDMTFPEGKQGISLKFTADNMATKADDETTATTVDGVDRENYVENLQFFIFPADSVAEDGSLAVKTSTEYIYTGTWTRTGTATSEWTYTSGDSETWVYKKTMTADELNTLFPNGATSAKVYAVANYTDEEGSITTIPADLKSWKEITSLEVGPTFYKDGGEGYRLRWPRPMATDDENLYFVMMADVDLILDKATGASAEVGLKRLASKVTVELTYSKEIIDEKGIKWIPEVNVTDLTIAKKVTRVYLSNAIAHSTISGPLTRDLVPDGYINGDKYTPDPNRDIFEYAYDYVYNLTGVPYYYTYPISLEDGDDNQPYLKLVLPWYGYKNQGSAESPNWVFYKQKEVYYKIVLPKESITECNKIYQFKVDVNIIGNDQEVEVTGEEYEVLDWSADDPIGSNLATGKYISLDLPKDTYDMYSSLAEILYISSGEVEISKLQIYKKLFNPSTTDHYYINGGPTDYQNGYGSSTTDAADPGVTLPNWVKLDGNKIVINHTLNTNISSSNVDISQYYFVVTLHLKSEPATSTRFDRTVTITQYPPIYVETISTSSNQVFLNSRAYGYGEVSNNHTSGTHAIGLGNIGGGQVNNGTSLTVVSVTTLASLNVSAYETAGVGTPLIGDPRITLSSAYPTDPRTRIQWANDDLGAAANNYIADYMYAGMDKSNFIAPKIMLASGYGANTGKGSWLRNAERCAAYQEAGYPAGRWRLPTEAEMMFVYTLGNMGLIVQPFQSSGYWANSGRYYTGGTSFTNSTSSNESRSVRCVYDLWYWGDDKLTNTTSWGGFQTDYINE